MTLLVFGGQESLDFEDLLDVVVTLGGGRRKPWRFVNESDLDSMDEVRFGNLAKQTSGNVGQSVVDMSASRGLVWK